MFSFWQVNQEIQSSVYFPLRSPYYTLDYSLDKENSLIVLNLDSMSEEIFLITKMLFSPFDFLTTLSLPVSHSGV